MTWSRQSRRRGVEAFPGGPVSNAGGKPAKAKREMDPMLRAAAKLDRLLAEMPAEIRKWALMYMMYKYNADAND